MNTFNKVIARLRPANREWQYLEIKELSERMEQAETQAREAIMVMHACKKEYARAYASYLRRLNALKWKKNG